MAYAETGSNYDCPRRGAEGAGLAKPERRRAMRGRKWVRRNCHENPRRGQSHRTRTGGRWLQCPSTPAANRKASPMPELATTDCNLDAMAGFAGAHGSASWEVSRFKGGRKWVCWGNGSMGDISERRSAAHRPRRAKNCALKPTNAGIKCQCGKWARR